MYPAIRTPPHAYPCVCISPPPAAASGLFMVFLWVTKLQPAPQLSPGFLMALMPVALFHTIGHVSACVSFSQMAVSFAHIVKAAEPVRSRARACVCVYARTCVRTRVALFHTIGHMSVCISFGQMTVSS